MKKSQRAVAVFLKARRWAEREYLYDTLLNTHKELAEIWNVIKHLSLSRDRKILKKNPTAPSGAR